MITQTNIIELSSTLNERSIKFNNRESFQLLSSLFKTNIATPDNINPAQPAAVFISSGGSEEMFMQILEKLPRPIIIISDSFSNSLPAALEICSRLERDSITFEHINIPLTTSDRQIKQIQEELNHALTIQRALQTLGKYRIALIGGESPWLISSDIDTRSVEDKYGSTFLPFTTDLIAKEFHKEDCGDDESKHLLDKITSNKELCLDHKSIQDAVKLYKVLNKFVIANNINALTIKCFDFLSSCKTTACLALALLNDKGIIGGCEGDVPALWSMILSREICNSVSFMANPSSIEKESGQIDFAHCTIPLSMGNKNLFTTHYESNSGVGVKSTLPEGVYTIFRNGDKTLNRLYCYSGKIIQNTKIKERCRTQVRFQFDNKDNVEDFLHQYIGNHTIIVPGNHLKILTQYSKHITKL